ncbi:unnamed protein product [Candidula unifasciata]|uniref:Uncharacterized protein n=1 Tax=Candidula unifasciata TaxID=100452 RepID=A0A8S3ZPV7_9EUPU|nr:unnamed protein product [Candidula unifasciata]
MSESILLQHRKSSSKDVLLEPLTRSQSVPLLPREDVFTHYTTPVAGVPSLLFFCLQVTRDFLSFVIRAGLSTMMFVMNLLLRLVLFITEIWLNIPGSFLVTAVVRFAMWSFQILLWATYTAVELLFYLPTPLLVVYLVIIASLYYTMPGAVEALLHSVWWMVEHFFKFLAYFAYTNSGKS